MTRRGGGSDLSLYFQPDPYALFPLLRFWRKELRQRKSLVSTITAMTTPPTPLPEKVSKLQRRHLDSRSQPLRLVAPDDKATSLGHPTTSRIPSPSPGCGCTGNPRQRQTIIPRSITADRVGPILHQQFYQNL